MILPGTPDGVPTAGAPGVPGPGRRRPRGALSPGRSGPSPGGTGPQAGFTLLELMLVLLIVALGAGMAVFSWQPDGGDLLAEQARTLRERMLLAGEEAVLQGRVLGLELRDREYRFLGLQDGAWVPVEDGLLRGGAFTEEVDTRLLVEGREAARPPADEPRPQILLLPSGESTPFELELELELAGEVWQLAMTGDADGRIVLREDGDA